jgi:hypothetical protein
LSYASRPMQHLPALEMKCHQTLSSNMPCFGFGSTDQSFFQWSSRQPCTITLNLAALHENTRCAATAIGQGELLVSPLNMGLVVLAALHGGDLPCLIWWKVSTFIRRSCSGRYSETPIQGLMKPQTASIVQDMMVTVVRRAAVSGSHTGNTGRGNWHRPARRRPAASRMVTGFAQDEQKGGDRGAGRERRKALKPPPILLRWLNSPYTL